MHSLMFIIKPTTEFARLIIHVIIIKAVRFAKLFKTHLDAVTERSATPSYQIIFKSICACEKNLRIFLNAINLDAQLKFLLTPQKFNCIDINTEPLVIQNEQCMWN